MGLGRSNWARLGQNRSESFVNEAMKAIACPSPGLNARAREKSFSGLLSLKNSMTKTERRQTFHFPRTPLLIEIERRCAFPDCAIKNQIGLTNDEAIEYRGFECSK